MTVLRAFRKTVYPKSDASMGGPAVDPPERLDPRLPKHPTDAEHGQLQDLDDELNQLLKSTFKEPHEITLAETYEQFELQTRIFRAMLYADAFDWPEFVEQVQERAGDLSLGRLEIFVKRIKDGVM